MFIHIYIYIYIDIYIYYSTPLPPTWGGGALYIHNIERYM